MPTEEDLVKWSREELINEVLRLREENEKLKAIIRKDKGKELAGLTWVEYCTYFRGIRDRGSMVKLAKTMFNIPDDVSGVQKPVKFKPTSDEFNGYVLVWNWGSLLYAVIQPDVDGKDFRNSNSNMCIAEMSGEGGDTTINLVGV